MTITIGQRINYTASTFNYDFGTGTVTAVIFCDFHGVALATISLDDGRIMRNIPVSMFGTQDSGARFEVVA